MDTTSILPEQKEELHASKEQVETGIWFDNKEPTVHSNHPETSALYSLMKEQKEMKNSISEIHKLLIENILLQTTTFPPCSCANNKKSTTSPTSSSSLSDPRMNTLIQKHKLIVDQIEKLNNRVVEMQGELKYVVDKYKNLDALARNRNIRIGKPTTFHAEHSDSYFRSSISHLLGGPRILSSKSSIQSMLPSPTHHISSFPTTTIKKDLEIKEQLEGNIN